MPVTDCGIDESNAVGVHDRSDWSNGVLEWSFIITRKSL